MGAMVLHVKMGAHAVRKHVDIFVIVNLASLELNVRQVFHLLNK